jgi:hypothetical protein
MGFTHEPPHELPADTRMCASLAGEAEAIDRYRLRLGSESDAAAARTA